MARYSAKNNEKVSPFVYCQTSQYAAMIDICELPDEMKRTGNVKIDINPCKDFRIMAAKDNDCNIDIYIHANPKHLVRNIPRMFREITSLATI